MNRIFRILNIFLAIVIVSMIVYWLSYEVPELFPSGAILFDIYYRMCEAYIVSYIFFLIIEYFPYKSRDNIIKVNFKTKYSKLVLNLTYLMQYLYLGISDENEIEVCGIVISYSKALFQGKLKENLFDSKVTLLAHIGSKTTFLEGIDPLDSLKLMKSICCDYIDEILLDKEFIDKETVYLLNGIKHSYLFTTISYIENRKKISEILKSRVEEVRNFYEYYSTLITLLDKFDNLDYGKVGKERVVFKPLKSTNNCT